MQCDDCYLAEWGVNPPESNHPQATWNHVKSHLICRWSWDHFVWDLPELNRLLRTRPSEFNYLYVTRHLKARAAYRFGCH